jgi:hypothetical protein
MRQLRKNLVPLLTAAALFGCDASPDTDVVEEAPLANLVTVSGDTATITPSDDTVLRLLSPQQTGGSETSLLVDGVSTVRTLVQFSRSDLQQATTNRAIRSARLEVTINRPGGAAVFGSPNLRLHQVTRAWHEATATWSSTFGLNDGFNPTPTDSKSVFNGQTGTITFDVTNDVLAILDGAPDNGWLLGQETPSLASLNVTFASRESTSGPHLVLDLVPGTLDPASVVVTKPAPGTIVFDASSGAALDVPEHGRTFASRSAAVDWAVTNLNAMRQIGDDGQPGFVLQEIVYGDPVYADAATESLLPVSDVAEALIAGRDGYVTIAGTRYCLRDQICGPAHLSKPPATASDCDSQNKFCIHSESFNHQVEIPFVGVKLWSLVGTETKQSKGGYKESREFCWKHHVIPWVCTKKSGKNFLEIANIYRAEGGGLSQVWNTSKRNTTSIQQTLKGFFVKIEVENGGGLSNIETECTDVCEVKGVCGWSGGSETSDGPRIAEERTSKGDVSGSVCDPILLKAGTSQP